MKPVPFTHTLPASLPRALALAGGSGEVKIIGGGQSLGPMLNLRLSRPEVLIDVSSLEEMRGVRDTSTHIRIGAAIRHAEIEDGAVPDPIPGMLRNVASGIAYRAVRNKGTIGGSLCHADPAADWVSAMTALDAVLIIAAPGGSTREVAMTRFMAGAYRTALMPGEVLRDISILKFSAKARWGYYKICRKVGEFADAIAAIVIDPERHYCRVVFGAASGAPLLACGLARQLSEIGEAAPEKDVKAELRALDPGLDDIKIHQLAVAYRRCVAEALAND